MTATLRIFCDLEGVLAPEMWPHLAEVFDIEELLVTTRDVPDYRGLMCNRLRLLRQNGVGIENVCHAIAALKPFDGAIQFLEQAASFGHVVIVSDSFSPMNSSILEILGCRISHGETMIILAQTVPQRATPSPPPSHSHPEPARHCFTQRNTSSARQRTAASDNSHMPRNV